MGAGQKVYTYVNFSSQNILRLYKSIATIKFLNNKVVQRSPFRQGSEMKQYGTAGEKMATLVEVLRLATHEVLSWGKCDFYG